MQEPGISFDPPRSFIKKCRSFNIDPYFPHASDMLLDAQMKENSRVRQFESLKRAIKKLKEQRHDS